MKRWHQCGIKACDCNLRQGVKRDPFGTSPVSRQCHQPRHEIGDLLLLGIGRGHILVVQGIEQVIG